MQSKNRFRLLCDWSYEDGRFRKMDVFDDTRFDSPKAFYTGSQILKIVDTLTTE